MRRTVDGHLLPVLVECLFEKGFGDSHASVRDESINLPEVIDHGVHRLLDVIVIRNYLR